MGRLMILIVLIILCSAIPQGRRLKDEADVDYDDGWTDNEVERAAEDSDSDEEDQPIYEQNGLDDDDDDDDVEDPNDAAEYGSPVFDNPETKNFNPDSLALQAENVSVQAVEEETGIANAISIGECTGKGQKACCNFCSKHICGDCQKKCEGKRQADPKTGPPGARFCLICSQCHHCGENSCDDL